MTTTVNVAERVAGFENMAETGAIVWDLVELKKALRAVLLSAEKDTAFPALASVAVDGEGRLLSTDRYRLARFELKGGLTAVAGEPVAEGEHVMLHADLVKQIIGIKTLARTVGTVVLCPAEGTVTVTVDWTSETVFKLDEQLNESDYPKIASLFPDKDKLGESAAHFGFNPAYLADAGKAFGYVLPKNTPVEMFGTGAAHKPVLLTGGSHAVFGEILLMPVRLS